MAEKRRKCPRKRSIDAHAKKALQQLRKVAKVDKKRDNRLKMQLDAAEEHLKAIMADHHLL